MKSLFQTASSRNDNLGLAVIVGLAVLKLVIHLLTSSSYGYFRDEFYYIAASKHLAFGYVDFAPFIALLTAFVRLTLGEVLLYVGDADVADLQQRFADVLQVAVNKGTIPAAFKLTDSKVSPKGVIIAT